MNYNLDIIIRKPVKEVVALFDNPENMKHWQPGLISFEVLEGTPGQPGARSRLHYKMGKREVKMIETIEKRNLPDEFTGTYKAKGVFNRITNRFMIEGEGNTKYVSEVEFRFSGFMRIIAMIMPGAFRKQTYKYMEQFRDFCEKQ